MSHHNPAQQDSTEVRGPAGPTRVLGSEDLDWRFTGPAHFGAAISSEYPNGDRVIWSNGGDRIVKLDARTFAVLATYPLPGKQLWAEAEADAALDALTNAAPDDAPSEAIRLAARTLQGLAGVYAMVDRDGRFYVSDTTGLTVYGDAVDGDPASPIVVRARWTVPPEVTGALVGMNMTYDGWIVLVSENGDVVALDRDLQAVRHVDLPHSDEAEDFNEAARAAGRTGYGWVRNSYAIDEAGGIYVVSAGYLHKVVWTGDALSVDPSDGAWSEPYRDGRGLGSGATPVLMGFGPHEDHLVAFTDGDDLMNMTVYWRDEIPRDWKQLDEAPSRRTAGLMPVDLGDRERNAIQSEQATIVAGFGALVVNNEPASIPAGFPGGRATSLLSGYLGTDARFTPHGMEKFVWDQRHDRLRVAWVNADIASPNSVPFVSTGSDLVYTVGARDGSWTLEAVDWTTGKSAFHYTLPGAKYNSLFAGVILDDRGNVVFGTPFGKLRIERAVTDAG